MRNYITPIMWIALAAAFAINSAHAQNLDNVNVGYQDDYETNGMNRSGSRASNTAPGGVVILNSQQAGATADQRQSQVSQPTTYVEASPLVESRADAMRKARQGAEVQTEQKIVEKLEESRLEDERPRADRLFGDRFEPVHPVVNAPTATSGVVVAPVVTKSETNVGQVNVDSKDNEVEIIKGSSHEKHHDDHWHSSDNKYYVGGNFGVAEYFDISNMQGNGALGFTLGTIIDNGFMFEGSFLYSNYYIDEFWKIDYFKEMNQYNYNFTTKYSPFKYSFRPYVGASLGYTYRSYTNRTPGYYQGIPDDDSINTNAVDLGLLLGLDLAVTDNFMIGAEYRYNRNLINRSEYDFLTRSDLRMPQYGTPIEELSYYTLLVNGKFLF
ncbi:MAG: outer membrane beta-barrel protein [Bdellovibrionales bacterium]|nr:outer membrane beta-barrel protein [Bdellovibrionales bacterium]